MVHLPPETPGKTSGLPEIFQFCARTWRGTTSSQPPVYCPTCGHLAATPLDTIELAADHIRRHGHPVQIGYSADITLVLTPASSETPADEPR